MKKSIFAEMKVLFEVPVSEPMDEMSLLEAAYKVSDEMTEGIMLVFETVTGEKVLVKVKDWNTNILGLHDEDGCLVS